MTPMKLICDVWPAVLGKKDFSGADSQRLEATLEVVSQTVVARKSTSEDWKKGGNARAALHAVVGGLTLDWLGALGATASWRVAPDLQSRGVGADIRLSR